VRVARLRAFTTTNLEKQGFGALAAAAQGRYAWPLRFTPGVGTTLVAIGLVRRSPRWLGTMALVAVSGALLPNGMLIDLVYNHGVRHVFRAPPLPATPKPRQFSSLLSASLLAGAAGSFHYKRPVWGLLFGGPVVVGGTLLTTTLWCFGSWCYRRLFRSAVAASWHPPQRPPVTPGTTWTPRPRRGTILAVAGTRAAQVGARGV
jgi:hypothetical protein